MPGYTPDEKLRLEQLTKLRRQWLKDQELSAREPVIQPKPLGAVAKFWASFLEPKSLWRLYVSTDAMLTLPNKLAKQPSALAANYIETEDANSRLYAVATLHSLSYPEVRSKLV